MTPTQKILDAEGYLRGLLRQLAHKHFSDRHPDWKPAGTLIEMLVQLDNMTTAMVRAPHSLQGISAGDKDRERSVDGPGTRTLAQAEAEIARLQSLVESICDDTDRILQKYQR